MPTGHSYSYFSRTKHFRLGEKSGRSSVVYGVLYSEKTNSKSPVLSGPQLNFILTNGRSFVSQQFTQLTIEHSAGPSQGTFPSFNFGLFTSQTGPSQTSSSENGEFVSQTGPSQTSSSEDGEFSGQTGPSHASSGDYQEIKLINKFGHRTEGGALRGFNVAQTQPTPNSFDSILTPPILRQEGFAVWLDAQDAVTGKLSVNPADNTVAKWINKAPSGTSWNQTSSSSRPIFNSTAKNGLGGVEFDGSSRFMTNTELNLASTLGEVFFVVKPDDISIAPAASIETLLHASQASESDMHLGFRMIHSQGGVVGPETLANNTAGQKGIVFNNAVQFPTGVVYIIHARSSGLGVPWCMEANGSGLQGTVVDFAAHEGVWWGGIGGYDTITLGAATLADTTINLFTGTLYEMLAYEDIMTDAARSSIVSHLADKWAIPLTGVL